MEALARRRLWRWGVLAAALGILAGVVWLEPRYGSVEGTVVASTTGQPLPKAEVLLRGMGVLRYTRTDAEGGFRFEEVPGGRYEIEAHTHRHSLPPLPLEVQEGKRLRLRLELSPGQPFLEVLLPQKVFLSDEPVKVGLHGFAPERTVQMQVSRYNLLQALRDNRAPRSWEIRWQGRSLPSAYLGPWKTLEVPLTQRDPEGIFTQYLEVPTEGPGAYVVSFRLGGLRREVLLFVSDLALVAKEDGEQLLVFASHLKTGEPLAGIHLLLQHAELGKASVTLQGRTNEQGLAWFSLAKVPRGSYSLLGWGERADGVHYSVIPFYLSPSQEEYTVHFITDRPIYRPGQRVFFKGIVRRKVWEGGHRRYRLPPPQPIAVEVRDGEGDLVDRQTLPLSPWGSFWGSVDLPEEVRTGFFSLEARIGEEVHQGGFQVAAYRKPPFRIILKAEKPYFFPGEKVRIHLEARYYFDAPVAGAEVRYSVSVRDTFFRPGSEEIEEGEEEAEGAYGEHLLSGQTHTDKRGRAVLEWKLKDRPKGGREGEAEEGPFAFEGERAYRVEVWVRARGFQEALEAITVYQVPGPFFIEVEPSAYWLGVGGSLEVRCRALGYDGRPQAGLPLQALWGKAWWEERDRKWVQRFEERQRLSLLTDKEGWASFSFVPMEEGSWLIAVRGMGPSKNLGATVECFVEKEGAPSLPSQRPGLLQVALDRLRYRVGEKAQVAIQASPPASGAVLLTIEGERLHEWHLLPLSPRPTKIALPVTEDYAPNVFLDARRVRRKELEGHTVSLRVEAPAQRLQVEMEAEPKEARPRQTVTLRLRTLRGDGTPVPAEVSLAVVDEAIFDLKKDEPEAILKTFYGKRWNRVQTYFSNPEEFLQGGKEQPSVLRKHFLDTAYWLPNLLTNERGEATVRITLPDNITTWRATAIAHSRDTAVGFGIGRVKSQLPLMVRLQTPRFLTQGDEGVLTALVHNETERAHKVRVRLEVAGERGGSPLEVLGPAQQQRNVPSHGLRSFTWRVRAGGMGTALLTVLARSEDGSLQDAMRHALPVRPYVLRQVRTFAADWSVEGKGKVDEEFLLSPQLAPEASRLVVSVTPFGWGSIFPALEALAGYPYGCTEQTMSRFLPSVLLHRTWRRLRWPLPSGWEKELPRMVQAGLLRLYRFQHRDGGWGWWEYDDSDLWMSAYVMSGLLECQRAGFEVSPPVLEEGRNFLRQRAEGNLFAVWVLARLGEDPRPFLRRWYRGRAPQPQRPERVPLREWDFALGEMTSQELAWLALTLKAVGASAKMAKVLNALEQRAGADSLTRHWEDVDTTAWALRALVEGGGEAQHLAPIVRWLTQRWSGGLWHSTRDTALVLTGLLELAERWGSKPLQVRVQVSLNGHPGEPQSLTLEEARGGKGLRWVFPGSLLRVGPNGVQLQAQGQGWLQYILRVEEGLRVSEMPLRLTSTGLRLERRYERAYPRRGRVEWLPVEGEPLPRSLPLRGVVRVSTQRPLEHVIVEEPLPAGAEPLERGELSLEEWDASGYWWAQHEFRDDRVVFFIEHLPPGLHTLTYTFRLEMPGRYCALPAHLEGMYDPTVRAEGEESWVEVR